MLKLEMLPAGHGDCLWIEYGDPGNPRRVLIDGGTKGTYKKALRPKLQTLPDDKRRFELLVVTHIDADHIAGALELPRRRGDGVSRQRHLVQRLSPPPRRSPRDPRADPRGTADRSARQTRNPVEQRL